MGCTQSKIENEEAVSRCKERKQFMSKAVSSRNAFAAAHFAYTIALKNTGAALNDYCQGEVQHILPPSTSTHPSSSSTSTSIPSSSSSSSAAAAAAAAIQPPIDKPLPPPPPPLPDPEFPSVPLQRAASMPEIPLPISKKHPANAAIREEDEDEDEDEDDDDDDDGIALEHHRDSVGAAERSSTPPLPPQANSVPLAPSAETSGSGKTPVWLSDYFFNTEDIPVPSLSQPDEVPVATTSGGGDNDDDLPAVLPEKVVTEPPPLPPQQPKPVKKQKPVHHQYGASAGASESKRGRIVAATAQSVKAATAQSVNLLKIFTELDDHFLKASESAHEVSKMLEATRMHYHSNFADNRGHIDHSARVMRVITWNRSFKGVPIADDEKNADDGNDDFDNDESETHATVLDKMLAWEKKLYDEVKAGELMKIECQRKVALLNKQKKRGASLETLEKTKAALSHLHTRYIVDMQSMDSTVSEINRLRDKQLYPKLVDLVDGMAKMWETMYGHHRSQRKIIADLKNLDVSLAPKETSEQHHERTIQLCRILEGWHSHFQKVVSHQKEYIQALNSWLKLNLIPIEGSLKEKVPSPPRVLRPPIQPLLHAWHDLLEKLPIDLAQGVIYRFSDAVRFITTIQKDELKLKEKCEETRREYMRKRRAFEDWHLKYLQKRAAEAASKEAAAVADPESSEEVNQKDLVAERQAVVESWKIRVADDEDSYQRACKQVREKSVVTLRTHLPELFRAMSDFALACSEMYKMLSSITTQSQDTVVAN